MVLGKLGEQIVLMSQKAFTSIEFVNTIPAPNEIYLPKKLARDTAARKDFQQEKAGECCNQSCQCAGLPRGRSAGIVEGLEASYVLADV